MEGWWKVWKAMEGDGRRWKLWKAFASPREAHQLPRAGAMRASERPPRASLRVDALLGRGEGASLKGKRGRYSGDCMHAHLLGRGEGASRLGLAPHQLGGERGQVGHVEARYVVLARRVGPAVHTGISSSGRVRASSSERREQRAQGAASAGSKGARWLGAASAGSKGARRQGASPAGWEPLRVYWPAQKPAIRKRRGVCDSAGGGELSG